MFPFSPPLSEKMSHQSAGENFAVLRREHLFGAAQRCDDRTEPTARNGGPVASENFERPVWVDERRQAKAVAASSVESLAAFVMDPAWRVREAVARREDLSADLVGLLARDDHPWVRIALLRVHTDAGVLLRHDPDVGVRESVAQLAPDGVAAQLATDVDPRVRAAVAVRQLGVQAARERFQSDEDPIVRAAVASVTDVRQLLRTFASDWAREVYGEALLNPHCPREVLNEMTSDASKAQFVAWNPRRPIAAWTRIADQSLATVVPDERGHLVVGEEQPLLASTICGLQTYVGDIAHPVTDVTVDDMLQLGGDWWSRPIKSGDLWRERAAAMPR